MTREPLSGLVLRCYDDKAYLVHDRATGGPLGSVIAWFSCWGAYGFGMQLLAEGRTRTEALRAAWPDLTPPRGPMEPPDTATTRCAAPAPHSGEAQHLNGPQNDAQTRAA